MANAKAKLTQQSFPFNFQELAGTVLLPTALEQNLRVGAEQEGAEVPQAFFMQNMLPAQRGFQSVHYARVVGAYTYPVYMDKVHTLRDADGNVALYAHASGQNLIYTAATGAWTAFPTTSGEVSVAYLKGVSYVCIAGLGLYVYDFVAGTFDAQVVSGISFTNILGVCSASQYLLLWTQDTLAWSDPANPLDFGTSLAGSTQILANRGLLVQCLPITAGAIAYTTHNAISVNYTGNSNLPFAFVEIPNSAGIADSEHVAYEGTGNAHIAWTASGFMQVGSRNAELIWPELSDAIAAGLYSTSSGGFPSLVQCDALSVKVSNVGGRYVLVSVKDATSGAPEFRVAYVYDIALGRWGRLDIPHVDFFEYRAPEFVADLSYGGLGAQPYTAFAATAYSALTSPVGAKVPQFGTGFGCVQKLGGVYVALGAMTHDLEYLESAGSGAAVPQLFLGRYALQRPGAVQWNGLQLSNQCSGAELVVHAHDASGDAIASLEPVALARGLSGWCGRLTGAHISLQISGRLQLSSVEFDLLAAGTNYKPIAATAADGSEAAPADGIVASDVPVVSEGEYVV